MPDTFVLTKAILCRRFEDHGIMTYVTTYNFMKGIVLTNAAYTLTLLLGLTQAQQQVPPPLMEAVVLWAASLAVIALTYYATIVGMLIILWVANVFDIILPFLLVVAEFCLFSVLQSGTGVQYWPYGLSTVAIIICGILCNVYSHLKYEVSDDAGLGRLLSQYSTGMRIQAASSFLMALANVAVYIWLGRPWVSGAIVFVASVVALYAHGMYANELTALLARPTAQQGVEPRQGNRGRTDP